MIAYYFSNYADKQMQKLSARVQSAIIKKIDYYIATGNPMHYADSIVGERGKVYRFRIGDYRVIFDWHDNEILINKVAIRGKVY